MNKAFVKEAEGLDGRGRRRPRPAAAAGGRTQLTSRRRATSACSEELMTLLDVDRPKGRRNRLVGSQERRPFRERRLSLRQEAAAARLDHRRIPLPSPSGWTSPKVADPSAHHGKDQGLLRRHCHHYATAGGEERTITIKGIDEADSLHGEDELDRADMRAALLKAREGDEVQLVTPGGVENDRGRGGALPRALSQCMMEPRARPPEGFGVARHAQHHRRAPHRAQHVGQVHPVRAR